MPSYLLIISHITGLLFSVLDFDRVKAKKLLFDAICVALIIIAMLKNEQTSPDTANYIAAFQNSLPLTELNTISGWYEPGYILLNSLIKTLGLQYHFLFFCVAAASVCLYRKIIWEYSEYPFFSLFIYITSVFYLNEIIIIRSGLDTAMVVYNIKNIEKKNSVKSCILVLAAASFHVVGMIGIIPVILMQVTNQTKLLKCIPVLMISALAITIIISPLDIVLVFQNINLPVISARITKLNYYLQQNVVKAGIRRAVLYLPYLFFMFRVIKTKMKSGLKTNDRYGLILYYYLLCAIFFIVAFRNFSFLSRVNNLFLSANVLTVPYIIKNIKVSSNKNIVRFFAVVLCTYLFLRQNFFNSGYILAR